MVAEIIEWYAHQYNTSVGIANIDGTKPFKKFIANFPVRSIDPERPFPLTGRIRMSKFLELKMKFPLGAKGYFCSVMSAKIGKNSSTHYAYAYWRKDSQTTVPEYICISHTFNSCDGEYRQRFIRGQIFMDIHEKYIDMIAPLEEKIIDMIGKNKLKLNTRVYPENDNIIDQINDKRLLILAFATSIILDIANINSGYMMSHINSSYIAIMAKIILMHPEILTISACTDVILTRLFIYESETRCGQKIVPMFLRETMQPFDYNLAIWRELAVTQLVGDLVINYISPSFAIYNQWSYIEDVDAALFENSIMETRYKRGYAVDISLNSLREARSNLRNTAQNYATEELNAHMYESIEYAQSYLLMSSVAMLHTMEDIGWTMGSLPNYIRYSKNQYLTIINAFSTIDTAACYIFELVYAAHCLHTKIKVAHTDLHTNNMTLNSWAGIHDELMLKKYYDSPVIAYIIGPSGESDTYIFPATGITACIIDYSRCIIGPSFAFNESHSQQYIVNFYRDQVNRIMRTFHRYVPEYVEAHQNEIKAAILSNFKSIFPVLCAIDFISIGASIGAVLSSPKGENEFCEFKVSPEALKLAQQVEDLGRELLITGLHEIINKGNPINFPGLEVINRLFDKWKYTTQKNNSMQLVDAYNYNNELKYSGCDYAKYPPWARLDQIELHLGDIKMTDLFARGVDPFLATLHPNVQIEVVAEKTRAAQEKIDGKPISTASSWID